MPVKIIEVATPKGIHAFLQNNRNLYSYGLTWATDFYPEITLKEAARLGGANVTTKILMCSLNLIDDINGYHRVLERIEDRVPGISVSVSRFLNCN